LRRWPAFVACFAYVYRSRFLLGGASRLNAIGRNQGAPRSLAAERCVAQGRCGVAHSSGQGAHGGGPNVLAPLVVVPFILDPGSWVLGLGSWVFLTHFPAQPQKTRNHNTDKNALSAPPAYPAGTLVVWWPFPFLVVRWPFPFLPVERQQGTLPWVLRHKPPILLLSRPRENTQHSTCRALPFVYIRRTTRSNDRYLGHRNHITHHHHHLHSRSATSIISFYYMTMDD
jgi:hypothetical protein